MWQQYLAIFIILFFLSRVFWQWRKNHISKSEFIFWIVFWCLAGFAIIFLKDIDKLVAKLGFSGSGIDILLYLSIVLLFYYIFRLRLRIEKIERDITKIIRDIALKE